MSAGSVENTPSAILDALIAAERIFHWPLPGTTLAEIDLLLSPVFRETGASGRLLNRAEAFAILTERLSQPEPSPWNATGFHYQPLAPGLYLLTYNLVQPPERRTRRSTIWSQTPQGWRAVFHQGTVIERPE